MKQEIFFLALSIFFLQLLTTPSIALSTPQPPKAVNIDESKTRGINLYEQKKYGDALKKFLEVYNVNPRDIIVLHYISATQIALRNFNEALTSAKKSLLIDPNSDYGFMYSGEAYKGLKMYKEAISAFNKSNEINNFMGNTLNIGYCYYEIGNFDEAKKAFQKANKETKTIQSLMGLGRSNYSLESYQEAIENFKAALLLSKASAMNKVMKREIGYAYAALGDYKNADIYFNGGKFIGLEVEKDKDGLKVVSTKRGMPATLAGIENGDVLIFFNETELYDLDKFSLDKIFQETKEGDEINIKLLRNGLVLKKVLKKISF